MISPELRASILRLFHAERWKVGTIASQLGIHHTTVERALVEAGVQPHKAARPSKLDPFMAFIEEQLRRYPSLPASRLYHMVRERGYDGGEDHFRHVIALHRPSKPAEAYLRLRTLPGEQAQVDWAHFGHLAIGRATRPLMAFLMVLSYSRMVFLRFFLNQGLASFLEGHVQAFSFFGGSTRVVLYDNLKSAVLERRRDAIRFNPTLLELAAHYRFEPRPVAVARGNEKGRVEAAVRYVRSSFFAARKFADLDDLNGQALTWCEGVSAGRRWAEDKQLTVRQAFEHERSKLLSLPDTPFPSQQRHEVSVGKTPYVRFDLNDYSVPHTAVRRTVVVVADTKQVRVLDGLEEIARHERCHSKGEQIEDPRHIQALEEAKLEARMHRGMDRLHHAVPESDAVLGAIAERGLGLGSATAALLRLLDRWGAVRLREAMKEALAAGSPHPHSVRLILERSDGGTSPLPVRLGDDPRLKLPVRPHDLSDYDRGDDE